MKLSTLHILRASKLFDASVVPEEAPFTPQLTSLFGRHTFFVNDEGVCIMEPIGAQGGEHGAMQVVRLARWADQDHMELIPHGPENTDTVLILGKAA